MIAEKLGNTIVAPVIATVPEGHVMGPADAAHPLTGTLSILDVTFIQLLQQTGQSLRHAGFTRIVGIGDHGGYQRDLTVAATALNQQWKGSSARAIGLLKYYQLADQDYTATLRADGYADNEIGTHAALADTALELATAPQMVRSDRLEPGGSATGA